MSAARRLAAAVLALLALFRPALGVGADGGRLGGVLVAADGATAAGFTVHLIDGVGHEVASAEVGADGVYAFDHVPAGRYALGIGNPAGQRAPVATPAIVVTPGATVRRDLLLVGADAAAG
ncbi:MAG TPA: carboxypeptidase-like regulatory domain-containing protein, partial [Candidatus Polarisedimenticolaceae bacterium]|nr:carboxypeptidase-like regulatory domain-containing protein [Candidatus Polarisedimenticolaceae bacterium]